MYYGGNYDTYMATREALEENQAKRYEKQQADVASLKDFVARFGHGTKKMAQQAQSREKLLAKVLEEDTVEKVEKDAVFKMRFPDPGAIPPPVLQLQNVSFHYPGCEDLYKNVDFGVDLESRICLVGPNGKGKTTMLKMLSGKMLPPLYPGSVLHPLLSLFPLVILRLSLRCVSPSPAGELIPTTGAVRPHPHLRIERYTQHFVSRDSSRGAVML